LLHDIKRKVELSPCITISKKTKTYTSNFKRNRIGRINNIIQNIIKKINIIVYFSEENRFHAAALLIVEGL
jgi:hypothetical protein